MLKKTIISILFLSSCSLFAQNMWFVQNIGDQIRSVSFPGTSTGWAGIWSGLYKTTNSGITWTPQKTLNIPYKIQFLDNNTGFSAFYSISKTTNGGNNWFTTYVLNNGENIVAMFFINTNTGWCGSNNGKILKTTNGGNNWQNILDSGPTIISIFFTDALTGWCGRYSGTAPLTKTTNGGTNWFSQSFSGSSQVSLIKFIDNNTGWVSDPYNLFRTTDGGNQWNLIYTRSTGINTIFFINANTGWMGCLLGDLLKTTNSGLNWSIQLQIGTGGWYNDICFNDINTGWVGGSNGSVYKTTNSGTNWLPSNTGLSTSDYKNIKTLIFLNENTGWADLLKTTNGGVNWFNPWSNIFSTIQCSFYLNTNIGFIVNYYTIYNQTYTNLLRTTNGGVSWNAQITLGNLINKDFKCFDFVNNNTGWCVGAGGLIYKTINNGISWSAQNSGTNYSLYTVKFVSTDTGLCTTEYGNLLKTTNGGINWYLQPTGAAAVTLRGLYMLNSSTGWITGDSGKIYKTTNRGINWISQQSNVSNTLNSVFFIDNNTGWVCGQTGIILKTVNSGVSWKIDLDNTGTHYNSIKFINPLTGWIAGDGGVILKTTTGGTSFIKIINNNIANEILLSQNYPNPFNPTTTISYKVESYKVIKLSVYDILGKEIATLVNEKLSAGTYEVKFDAGALPSGIYFYKLETEKYSDTKKMILLK